MERTGDTGTGRSFCGAGNLDATPSSVGIFEQERDFFDLLFKESSPVALWMIH